MRPRARKARSSTVALQAQMDILLKAPLPAGGHRLLHSGRTAPRPDRGSGPSRPPDARRRGVGVHDRATLKVSRSTLYRTVFTDTEQDSAPMAG